jgi:DNA-binding HxlR family transcriptional regulator|tara:strand:+ start:311 stop:472 length:162 start_codon:yes stop_codon:yes gene_type:complete
MVAFAQFSKDLETNKTSASTLEERLSNLKKLEQKGLITKEEAQQKRKKLLNEL